MESLFWNSIASVCFGHFLSKVMTFFDPFSVNSKFLGETRQSGFPDHMLCNCVGRPLFSKRQAG